MIQEIIISVLVTTIICAIVAYGLYRGHNKRQLLLINKTNLKLENLTQSHNSRLREEYQKGYNDALKHKEFTVQVYPWSEEIDANTFWKNKKSISIGYKYQIFSNGIPLFSPQIIETEKLTVDKVNKENIEKAFENLESIMSKIPTAQAMALNILGSTKKLSSSLINKVKSKK
ncbi:hypothetical protein MED134_07039 [Dokdonia sp. MED134]|uniref:hypothetical protein n=1 Tax=Dokdonia sp. MED134 TaxID=313590 RepID=UPI000068AAD3|nr:hypothetical protein [Dokdonia sp. MED134]EAQ40491.1 hypothetical protein MED134_07039 [Dokdonia sp. MED134]